MAMALNIPVLETERLLLRRARPGDLDSIHAVLSDPRAMRYYDNLHVVGLRDSYFFDD